MLVPVTEAEIAGASNLHFFFAIYPTVHCKSQTAPMGNQSLSRVSPGDTARPSRQSGRVSSISCDIWSDGAVGTVGQSRAGGVDGAGGQRGAHQAGGSICL